MCKRRRSNFFESWDAGRGVRRRGGGTEDDRRPRSPRTAVARCLTSSARGENRTRMPLPARDFESRASTSSATRARDAQSSGAVRAPQPLSRSDPTRARRCRSVLVSLELPLPHLRDPLPDLLLERGVLGALYRRQKSGQVLLLLSKDLQARLLHVAE